MQGNELVSVIIPAYNCESTIERCVQSALNQLYGSIEVIIVDDGSNDNTAAILKDLSLLDSRIKYFYKENGGVSSARNLGIKKATGKYLFFLDSDDYIYGNSIGDLARCFCEKVDFVISNYFCSDRDLKQNNIILSKKQFLDSFFSYLNSGALNPPWGRMFRKSIIENNFIKFEETLNIGEDLQFNLSYINYISGLCFINKKVYFYNRNRASLTKKYHVNLFESRKKSVILFERFLINNNLPTKVINFFIAKLLYAELIQDITFSKTVHVNLYDKVDNLLQKKEVKKVLCEKYTNNFIYNLLIFSLKTRNKIIILLVSFLLYFLKLRLPVKRTSI